MLVNVEIVHIRQGEAANTTFMPAKIRAVLVTFGFLKF